MTVPAVVSEVLARIESLSARPAAIGEIESRFAAMAGRALSVGGQAGTAGTGVGAAAASRAASVALPTFGAADASTDRSWVARIPSERGKAYAPAIEAAAAKYRLEPAFLAAVFWTESSYHPDAVSRTGAIGLGQLMPETAAWLGVDPWDPMQNIEGAAKLYRYHLDQWHGDMSLAIASYAAGAGAVKRAGGVPDDFTARYIDKLLARTDFIAGRRANSP